MKYSIIVPAHNSAGFISKCLESVKQQTVTDYELIVVCDRCQDNTEEIVRPYADKVLITDYGNDGPPRQAGVDIAQGEWILFLDDDDYWLHEYVLDLVDKAITNDIDVLCYGFIFKGQGYAPPIRTNHGRTIFWPSVWNKCYRRSFIADTPLRYVEVKGTRAPDIDWTSRLIAKDFRYAVLDQALYYYNYMRKGSQTDKLFKNEKFTILKNDFDNDKSN